MISPKFGRQPEDHYHVRLFFCHGLGPENMDFVLIIKSAQKKFFHFVKIKSNKIKLDKIKTDPIELDTMKSCPIT